jgi:hypothetical protein
MDRVFIDGERSSVFGFRDSILGNRRITAMQINWVLGEREGFVVVFLIRRLALYHHVE